MDCYLLIGGESRRMGRRKEDVMLGGRSFVDRVRAAAESAFDRVVAVQRDEGPAAGALPMIRERAHESSGAIFGLERALADAAGPRLWLLAVDFPLVTGELLRDLRRRFEGSSAEALVPCWDGRPQPLCAGYAVGVRPRVEGAIAAGRLRMGELLDTLTVELVAEAELRRRHPGEPLLNVNDPAELERARRIDEEADPSR